MLFTMETTQRPPSEPRLRLMQRSYVCFSNPSTKALVLAADELSDRHPLDLARETPVPQLCR
jgi:hypothetical protein